MRNKHFYKIGIAGSMLMILLSAKPANAQAVHGAATDTLCEGYKISGNKVYLFNELIAGSDAKSFTCIEAEYSKDKNHVYFRTKIFKAADASSFTVLASGYAKDKNHVYYNYYSGKIIKGADPKTFRVLDIEVSIDKNWVYVRNSKDDIIKKTDADAKTFKEKDGYYYDKNFLYGMNVSILARRDTFDVESFLNTH